MPRISKKKCKTLDSSDDESVVSQRVVSKKKTTATTRRSSRRATQRKVYRDASDSEDSCARPVKKAKNTKNTKTKTKTTTARQAKRSANSDTDATADSSSDEGNSIASYKRKAVRKEESNKSVARKRARLGKKDIVGNDAIVSPPPPMHEVGDWRDFTALDY